MYESIFRFSLLFLCYSLPFQIKTISFCQKWNFFHHLQSFMKIRTSVEFLHRFRLKCYLHFVQRAENPLFSPGRQSATEGNVQ